MDLKQIKELMAAMEKAGLKRLRIKQEKGFEIELEKPDETSFHGVAMMRSMESPPVHFVPPASPPHKVSHEEKAAHHHSHEKREETPGRHVTSPMVGTFYTSPSPDDPVFVKVGDRVEEDTIICIIEAMKVMNEVKAGMKGQVAEVLIENAHPVEFGTKMFLII